MKIAIISEYNSFTTTGGTEYYINMLLEGLCKNAYSVLFISRGKQKDGIEERFVNINDNGYSLVLLPEDQYQGKEIRQKTVSKSWDKMLPFLQAFSPAIIHVHTLSTFFNIRHFELLRKYFSFIIFTSHVPGNFCTKGDMIRNNKEICNGKIGWQCNICLFSAGIRRGVSNMLKGYSNAQLQMLQKMAKMQVHIVNTSIWQQQQLLLNDFPEESSSVIRQALLTAPKEQVNNVPEKKFRIGYLGRLSPEKGSLLLLELVSLYQDRTDVSFIFGVPANSDISAMEDLSKLIDGKDVDIELRRDVTAATKARFFEDIDVLFIPSYCIETGPIVLLEAVYYRKKVLAPMAGGPAEFAEAYPQFVTCYQWNNLISASEQLEKLSAESSAVLPGMDAHFKEKQTDFISQHLSLYNRLINNSRNQRI